MSLALAGGFFTTRATEETPITYSSVQFNSVAQSCPTLCDPMNHSTTGFPVYQQHYSAIIKNTFESVLMRWMKLEPIIQSEVSQKEKHQYSTNSVQFSSVAQSCPALCDPMNCSTPGLPVHHQLPEFTQTCVH